MLLMLHLALLLFLRHQVYASGYECKHDCLSSGHCKLQKLDDVCYYYYTDIRKSWQETRDHCKSENMSMVKLPKEIIKNASNMKILGEPLKSSSPAWLGGKSRDLGRWKFLNDISFNYNDHRASPSLNFSLRRHRHKCGILYHTEAGKLKINIESCHLKYPHICHIGKKNQLTFASANWYDARMGCIDRGGDLFYLEQDENLIQMKKELAHYMTYRFFIGLRHEIWKWEDGEEILQFNWRQNEPSDIDEQCLMMDSDGTWNDMHCSSAKSVFCQRGKIFWQPPQMPSSVEPATPTNDEGSINAGASGSTYTILLWALLIPTILLIFGFFGYMTYVHKKMHAINKRTMSVDMLNGSLSSWDTLDSTTLPRFIRGGVAIPDGSATLDQMQNEDETVEDNYYDNNPSVTVKKEDNLFRNEKLPPEQPQKMKEVVATNNIGMKSDGSDAKQSAKKMPYDDKEIEAEQTYHNNTILRRKYSSELAVKAIQDSLIPPGLPMRNKGSKFKIDLHYINAVRDLYTENENYSTTQSQPNKDYGSFYGDVAAEQESYCGKENLKGYNTHSRKDMKNGHLVVLPDTLKKECVEEPEDYMNAEELEDVKQRNAARMRGRHSNAQFSPPKESPRLKEFDQNNLGQGPWHSNASQRKRNIKPPLVRKPKTEPKQPKPVSGLYEEFAEQPEKEDTNVIAATARSKSSKGWPKGFNAAHAQRALPAIPGMQEKISSDRSRSEMNITSAADSKREEDQEQVAYINVVGLKEVKQMNAEIQNAKRCDISKSSHDKTRSLPGHHKTLTAMNIPLKVASRSWTSVMEEMNKKQSN